MDVYTGEVKLVMDDDFEEKAAALVDVVVINRCIC